MLIHTGYTIRYSYLLNTQVNRIIMIFLKLKVVFYSFLLSAHSFVLNAILRANEIEANLIINMRAHLHFNLDRSIMKQS